MVNQSLKTFGKIAIQSGKTQETPNLALWHWAAPSYHFLQPCHCFGLSSAVRHGKRQGTANSGRCVRGRKDRSTLPKVSCEMCGMLWPVASDSFDPVDCSPPGSSVQGILQARILEWIAISFSRVMLDTGEARNK